MTYVVGMKLGKLTLIEYLGRAKHNHKQWLCLCDCGNKVIREEGNLKTTRVPHCGCSPGWKGHNKRFVDISGQIFGRLTVKYFFGKDKYSHNLWFCECECGGKIVTDTNALRRGKTQSCGCIAKELLLKRSITHNKTHSRLYRTYRHMMDRCYLETNKDYASYGGRGIQMCDDWLDNFEAFYDWAIAHGYSDSLTIERVDNDGNYEPNNCRWATMKDQGHNKRNSIIIEYNGERRTLGEWADLLGIRYRKLYYRIIIKKWNIETAFTTK